MKTVSLMNRKGGYVKLTQDDMHRVLAIPFRSMMGGRRALCARVRDEEAGSWVLDILSGLAWMG